jgi:hypothetical protein
LFLLLGGVVLCVLFLGGAVAAGTYVLMSLDFGRDEFRPAQTDGDVPADRLGGGPYDGFDGTWHDGGPGGVDPNVWAQPGADGSPFEPRPNPDAGFGQPDLTFGQQEQQRLLREMEAERQRQLEGVRRQQEEIRRQNEELLRRPGPRLPQPPTPPGFRPPF